MRRPARPLSPSNRTGASSTGWANGGTSAGRPVRLGRVRYLSQFVVQLQRGGVAAFIVTFLVQLNRDELVSRVTRSTPNKFTPDWSFLHGTAAYVLPIVAGLMLQFPFVTSMLRALFDPLFHVIK